jgi:hypothetical protein
MKSRCLAAALSLAAALPSAAAGKACTELMAEIDAKIQAKGVKHYTLEVVEPQDVQDAKVVGTCDGGTKRIIYRRGKAGGA